MKTTSALQNLLIGTKIITDTTDALVDVTTDAAVTVNDKLNEDETIDPVVEPVQEPIEDPIQEPEEEIPTEVVDPVVEPADDSSVPVDPAVQDPTTIEPTEEETVVIDPTEEPVVVVDPVEEEPVIVVEEKTYPGGVTDSDFEMWADELFGDLDMTDEEVQAIADAYNCPNMMDKTNCGSKFTTYLSTHENDWEGAYKLMMQCTFDRCQKRYQKDGGKKVVWPTTEETLMNLGIVTDTFTKAVKIGLYEVDALSTEMLSALDRVAEEYDCPNKRDNLACSKAWYDYSDQYPEDTIGAYEALYTCWYDRCKARVMADYELRKAELRVKLEDMLLPPIAEL